MENDFFWYSIGRFVFLIKYIESLFDSLEINCLVISDRLNTLNNRIFYSQALLIKLDYKEEFKRLEAYSLRDFMLLDDNSRLKNSYFVSLKDCKKLILLIKENFPKFLNSSSSILNKPNIFSERAVDVNMESSQSKSYEQLFRCQRKEDIRIKGATKASNSKNNKISSFKSSIEKLLRIKSRSEKSLKHEDFRLGMIPQTIYLSPQQTVSRDTWYIANEQQVYQQSKQPIRHSCSDFACRRNSTFCLSDNVSTKQLRAVSPPVKLFSPVTEEESQPAKIAPATYSNVSHSISMPAQLSKSHQNISKCVATDIDFSKPAKRTTRKKGIFNCSLFRKRSNSHSKSTEKMNDIKLHRPCDKTKSLNRSNNDILSSISDRSLTLPNLKSSEVDLTQNLKRHQLLSMDLIKDFIDRSNNSIHSSVNNRNSIDCSPINPSQKCSVSVHNSPHTSIICKCYPGQCNAPRTGICDSMIVENQCLSESFYLQKSACTDNSNSRHQRATSPLTLNSCAFDTSSYKYSNVTHTVNEKDQLPCVRQISAPNCYQHQQQQSSHQYLSPPLPNSAFEFWTRPYHEKMKASRRRLLDDKVGSKEALLRSLSPHNLKSNDPYSLYDNPHQLHIIPEPTNSESNTCLPMSKSPISHSKSFYSAVQYRLTSQDNIFHEHRPHSSTSPVIENRLLESPISISKRKEAAEIVRRKCGNDYIIYNTDDQNETNNSIFVTDSNLQSSKETNSTNSDNIYHIQKKDFCGSFPEIKDNKSVNSSTELILTRTPTPPHSFAESSVSSIYPAPNEFISDQSKSHSNTHKMCGTVNLLYTSDNSEEGNDEFDKMEIEPIPPVPPPRTDSVLRSLQAQQNVDTDKSEQEYDISDEFPPIFSGANIDRCDIEQYHKWLEKLPYKPSEFPNLIQCRKLNVNVTKVSPLTDNLDCVKKKIDVLVKKQMKLSRKSIKSWTNSESSKPSDTVSIDSHGNLSQDSYSMKKSLSYDQYLNNSEMQSITENSPPLDPRPEFTVIDTTLLKQYSHLYSLKLSPSQTSKFPKLETTVLKFNRSKSIDLRNFVNNISGSQLSEKCLENVLQKRKSVPNTTCNGQTTTNDISGNSNLDTAIGDGSAYKIYPML